MQRHEEQTVHPGRFVGLVRREESGWKVIHMTG